MGKQLGRNHAPEHETVSLADYRLRHAQYKSDPDLQAAHAIAPWFCTWDDHESANNCYRTGAENHQPETEGEWSVRKAAAVQAYLEWMPVRDPVPGRAKEAIWRKFDIGELATLFLLETRLVGRGEELTFDELFMAPDVDRPAIATALKAKINDPQRTLLGAEQEAWLAQELKTSAASGKKWQVLGNQVTMAKVKMPDLQKYLPPEKYAQVSQGSKRFYATARWGLEWNLDAWAGFPAARERLYAAAKAAKARLITLTGDTHTSWANELHDNSGQKRGVEFGCTSVTSNGAGDNLPFEELNWMMPEANDEVLYYNAFSKGFTLLTLKADQVRGGVHQGLDDQEPRLFCLHRRQVHRPGERSGRNGRFATDYGRREHYSWVGRYSVFRLKTCPFRGNGTFPQGRINARGPSFHRHSFTDGRGSTWSTIPTPAPRRCSSSLARSALRAFAWTPMIRLSKPMSCSSS